MYIFFKITRQMLTFSLNKWQKSKNKKDLRISKYWDILLYMCDIGIIVIVWVNTAVILVNISYNSVHSVVTSKKKKKKSSVCPGPFHHPTPAKIPVRICLDSR